MGIIGFPSAQTNCKHNICIFCGHIFVNNSLKKTNNEVYSIDIHTFLKFHGRNNKLWSICLSTLNWKCQPVHQKCPHVSSKINSIPFGALKKLLRPYIWDIGDNFKSRTKGNCCVFDELCAFGVLTVVWGWKLAIVEIIDQSTSFLCHFNNHTNYFPPQLRSQFTLSVHQWIWIKFYIVRTFKDISSHFISNNNFQIEYNRQLLGGLGGLSGTFQIWSSGRYPNLKTH